MHYRDNRQWDFSALRMLLGEFLSYGHPIHDCHVEHDFPAIDKKIMLLNACRFKLVDLDDLMKLLAELVSLENWP